MRVSNFWIFGFLFFSDGILVWFVVWSFRIFGIVEFFDFLPGFLDFWIAANAFPANVDSPI